MNWAATPQEARRQQAVAGRVGLALPVLLATILALHPPGSTELYDDGVRFVQHVDGFWVGMHLAAAVMLLGIPLILGAWAVSGHTAEGALFADLAAKLSVAGVALGALHLVGTDTITFLAYQDTLAAGGEATAVGADVLLRLHAATLMVWTIVLLVAVPLAAAIAAWLDATRGWRFLLPLACACLAVGAAAVTAFERRWTTVSEMILFRSSMTLLLVWLFLCGLTLRRAARRT
jgi:hypothetical protein